jgi:carboxylesterase
MLHGMNSTPDDMAHLRERLESAGYQVEAPGLPGVGGGAHLVGVAADDWLSAAEDAWAPPDGSSCNAVVGLSLGGMLGTVLAARKPAEVHALVLLSPAARPPGGFLGRLLPLLHPLKKWLVALRREDLADPETFRRLQARHPDLDLSDPAVQEKVLRESRIPTRALVEMMKVQKRMLSSLAEVRAPVLLLFGGRDGLVSPKDEEILCCALGRRRGDFSFPGECECLGEKVAGTAVRWFPQSSHCLPCGPEREEVADSVIRFLEASCSHG